ncbi:MAG: hypothetical protein AAF327_25245, partial [Cyanobacteria bacterium P01_A01_bin.37]
MNPLPSERAKTLKTAFRACDVGALRGDNIDRYYVDLSRARSEIAIQNVKTRLEFLDAKESAAILFTGHRGCGKSTELRRIEREWQDPSRDERYRVIYLEANDEIDINDADFKDLYLVIVHRVARELEYLGLRSNPKLIQDFDNWFKDVTEEKEDIWQKGFEFGGSAEAGQQLPTVFKFIASLSAQMKGTETTRRKIREKLERSFSELQRNVNNLLADATEKIQQRSERYKGFLVIFDNLDRIPPSVGEQLFFKDANQLRELNCSTIYTVPISVVYSGKNLVNPWGVSPYIMPMVSVYQFERDRPSLDYNPEGLNLMAALIEQRIDIDAVFHSRDELMELAKLSGGHVRQLVQLMRTASMTASTKGHVTIQSEDVEYAANQLQFNFERSIAEDYYPALANIAVTKKAPTNQMSQDMLFNVQVMEYETQVAGSEKASLERWTDVNPLVRQINDFQTALQKVQAKTDDGDSPSTEAIGNANPNG